MEDAGSIRVGDAERRAADDLLQRAHGEGLLTLTEYEERAGGVWAARTRADLDALTADLPAVASTGRPPAAVDRGTGPAPWARRAGGLLGTLVVAVGVLWGGGQLVSRDDGAVVLGSRTITVAPGADRVELGVLFGSVEVVVPDDARVVVDELVVFGSVDCAAACSGTGPREITVDAVGGFGSVDVRTQREAAAGADRDDDDEDDD